MDFLHPNPTKLPVQLTSLVGREQEVAALYAILQRENVRLLTLTGPRGAGKTRLSLQVAVEANALFEDGVTVVMLASLDDPGLAASTISHALGIEDTSNRPLLEVIGDWLVDKQVLLVLDTAEQALPHTAIVRDLLDLAPRLKILVSNRVALKLEGEVEFPVLPLTLPPTSGTGGLPGSAELPPIDHLDQYSAVRLFVERSQAVRPDFAIGVENAAAVVEICSRLDGLPLGIELAAARVAALAPEEIWRTLEPYLSAESAGSRDLADRQQTLRATLDWTYDLLSAPARALLPCLALFVGGCDPEALAAVAGAVDPAALEALAQSGWVRRETGPADAAQRLTMLNSLREYALERLGEGELAALQGCYLDYYLGLAEAAEPELTGKEQARWLDRLAGEYANLRAALQWALRQRLTERGIRLEAALWRFWLLRDYVAEGRWWLEATLGQDPDVAPAARARALNGLGTLASVQGDYERAKNYFTASLALQQILGNPQGMGFVLNNLGLVANEQGDRAEAHSLLSASLGLWRELGDRRQLALTLGNLGVVAIELGDHGRAAGLLEESLGHWRALENRWGEAIALTNLGEALHHQGELARARLALEEGLGLCRQVGDTRLMTAVLASLGYVALDEADHRRARELFRESLRLREEVGDKRGIAHSLEAMAALLVVRGRAPLAARLLGVAEALREAIGTPLPPAEAPRHSRTLAALKRDLSADEFADAWLTGRATPPEQAVAALLSDQDNGDGASLSRGG